VREQVRDALEAGQDPVLVAAGVEANLDALVARHATLDLPGEPRPACARGCFYCCHSRVELTAPEVFVLARFLRAHPDPARDERLVATARELEGVDGRAYHRQQVRCALLDDDGACTVYPARPMACRRAHSTDASICAATHHDPSLDAPIPFAPVLQRSASALVLGWLEGYAHAGRAPHHYELHAALSIALADEGAEAKFAQGHDPLGGARTRDAEDLARVLGRAAVEG
jgi:hypothetical protein